MIAGDEDGNTPLMLAVRESPLSWPCLHTLIFFGAQFVTFWISNFDFFDSFIDMFFFRIEQKNMRGICPLDLAPELRKLQQTCVEELFKNACSGDSEPPSRSTPGPSAKNWNRLQVDNGECVKKKRKDEMLGQEKGRKCILDISEPSSRQAWAFCSPSSFPFL